MTAERTKSRWQTLRGRWPGLVWAVPLAATILIAYLGFQEIFEHGVSVHVQFGTAQGIKAGDTPVIYKGMQIGKVASIKLDDDKVHVDMRLLLNEEMKPLVVEGTQFWLVGAKPNFNDLSSITAAVTGMSIVMAPGNGPPARNFRGFDEPPIVMPDVPGERFMLHADIHGSVQAGASLYYRGEEAGKVTTVDFTGQNQFRIGIFVNKKFHGLVRPHTLFWNGAGVRLQLSSQGLTGSIPTPSELWSGGVEFGNEDPNLHEDAAPERTEFMLYPDRLTALDGPDGPDVLYEANFTGNVGLIGEKAPVLLNGFRVGVMRSHGLVVDSQTGAIRMPVVLSIQPHRMHVPEVGETDETGHRELTDRTLASLVASGMRLKLEQSPPIVGSFALAFEPGHGRGHLSPGTEFPVVPTVVSGDMSEITSNAASIMAKVNAIPIVEIGKNVRDMTSRLDNLMASAPMKTSLQHLANTLANVDSTVASVQPEIGPMVQKLRGAADAVQATAASANVMLGGNGFSHDASIPSAIRQLTDAARSMRDLADFLERHPESLLQGKAKESP